MSRRKAEINPISGKRLKEEMKSKGITQEEMSDRVSLNEKYIGFFCQGRRAIPREHAETFGRILGVRPEYLLGLDDYREYDLEWFNDAASIEMKKQKFFEHCLSFWGYEIVGNDPTYEDEVMEYQENSNGDKEAVDLTSRAVVGMIYKIRKPTGETVEIHDTKITRLQDDILRSVRRLLRETLDPEN